MNGNLGDRNKILGDTVGMEFSHFIYLFMYLLIDLFGIFLIFCGVYLNTFAQHLCRYASAA